MPVYNINSTESAKSQERCRYYRKKSGTHLDKQQHAPYYTYRDRHRKREFTFDKYEGIPEGGLTRIKAGLTPLARNDI